MTPDDGQAGEDAGGQGGAEQGAGPSGANAGMTAATPRQAILAVAVLCGLCLVIGIVLGRTL